MQFSLGGPGGPPRGRASAAPGRTAASRRRFFAAGAAVVMALWTAAVASPASAAPAASGAKVDKQVLTEIAKNGSTRFLVYLNGAADMSKASGLKDKGARGTFVYSQLTSVAENSQRDLTNLLKSSNVKYSSYWIANALAVTGDKALVDTIAARSDVTGIAPIGIRPLIEPVVKAASPNDVKAVEWGLTNIEAPRVWNEFGVRGEGIVVASIDTGVQFDHPAVVGKYRGNSGGGTFDHNYNWFDPSHICGNPSLAPCDNHGHGTHTMGTMVGDDGAGNQTGVAPGAKWISAKGCEGATGCSDEALLASGQWVIAPTNLAGGSPRPDLHPDVVNNSWGGAGNNPWYRATVQAWVAAGIMPVFANGNAGPSCGSAGSPGDYPESYAAGAYDINNTIAPFSSRGASQLDSAIKPNIAAPGVDVRSSVPPNSYALFSGTSMATPHVAGTVALIWSASPATKGDIAATRALLNQSATNVDALGCGGTVDFNNTFGEGRLNAYQAVLAAPRGPTGNVVGVVTDAATHQPIADATVTSEAISTKTGPDGRYVLKLPVGDHTVTVTKYAYAPQSATVTVTEGAVVTHDFPLVKLPVVTVSGRVLDGGAHQWPLYAKIEVGGREGPPVYANPVTGVYSFEVPASSTYQLKVTAQYPGYQVKTEDLVVGTTNVVKDISLAVPGECTAPGYKVGVSTPILSETFDQATTPAGWSVVKRATGAQWTFDDPKARGNVTGGTGGFAIGDSDAAGAGTVTDTDLITPALDFTGVPNPTVRFNSDFRDLGNDFADVDWSTDGGTTWTTAWHQPGTKRGPGVEEVALNGAGGKANTMIRFHYSAAWAWWWEIDNVSVINRSCDAVPGGLVVGFTTDSITGQPLNGVTVTSDGKPAEKGVSAATPDDPNIPDGFYWLFSSLTGAQPFTAAKPRYQSVTKTVTVAPDSATRADFAIGASRLTVTPNKIEAYQTLGQTRSTTVTVRNTGNAPAQVDLFERGGEFKLIEKSGAPLQKIEVPGGVPTGYQPKGPWAIVRPTATPTVGDAWTRIEDTPGNISDNSAAWLDGKVYSVGGGTDADKKLYIYDTVSGHWSTGADMPRGRGKPQAAALKGKLYVFGGWDSGGMPSSAVDVYDPAAASWSTLAATNPKPMAGAGTAVIEGKAYLVGGCADGACTASATTVKFDPDAESFALVAAYPHPVSWEACGGIGGKAYCAGGTAAASDFTDGFSYDPGSDSWTPIADMPFAQWGTQEAAAGGLLVLNGGVEGTALVNRTIAYDPASNTWKSLPNANFPGARGAGACGMYKIGGWSAPFTAAKESEFLADLNMCEEAADVPWLSENPQSFTLAPGASKAVTVTLTATPEAGVTQPGDYKAQIAVRSNSPYPVGETAVVMHVLPPDSWGKITGTVQGQTCGGSLVPLTAQLQISLVSNPDLSYTLKSNADGTYGIWLPRGRYEVIVSKDGWAAQMKRHVVKAGFVDPLDFTLKPFGGCKPRLGGV